MFDFDIESGELFIYDEIGPAWWGLIDAASVRGALSQMAGQHVTVRLNTPGGSVDEGVAIYNALKRHDGGVTTIVDSLAASMGSYLLQAGGRRVVARNAMVMVHDPWSISIGNAAQLRTDADILDKYASRMVPDYAERSGKSDDEIVKIMSDETWYAGQEIVDAGFADEVYTEDAVEPVLAGLHRIASKVPDALLKRGKAMQAGDRKPYPIQREAARLRMAVRR